MPFLYIILFSLQGYYIEKKDKQTTSWLHEDAGV